MWWILALIISATPSDQMCILWLVRYTRTSPVALIRFQASEVKNRL